MVATATALPAPVLADRESFTPEPSLHAVLAQLGLTTTPGTFGARHIIDAAGVEVFTGGAGETWAWLRETGRMAKIDLAVAFTRAATVTIPALQAEIARQRKPLIWDYLPGSHRTLIAAVSYEGDEVEHATYRWSRDGLVECNGRLHDEAVDALRNDLESGRHMYRGDVPRQERTPRVSELQDAADHGEVSL